MKCGDARRQRRERPRSSRRIDSENRAGPIADKQRPVSGEREPAGDAKVAGKSFGRSVGRHAVHGSLESARHVQPARGIDRHRRRVHDAGREGLARAVRTHAKNGHRHLLAARAAIGHIEIAVTIEDRVIDLVKTGGKWRGDVDERTSALRRARAALRSVEDPGTVDAHGRAPALEVRGDDRDEPGWRQVDETGGRFADTHLGQFRLVNGKPGAFDGDAAAFNRTERMDGGYTRGRHAGFKDQLSTLNSHVSRLSGGES